MTEPGTRPRIEMDPIERALDAIRYAAKMDHNRHAHARAHDLEEAARLIERLVAEIGRLRQG